jgi:hypothetical protein
VLGSSRLIRCNPLPREKLIDLAFQAKPGYLRNAHESLNRELVGDKLIDEHVFLPS